jgi:hypothetical protein
MDQKCEFCSSSLSSEAKICGNCGVWKSKYSRFVNDQSPTGLSVKGFVPLTMFAIFLYLIVSDAFEERKETFSKEIHNSISIEVPDMVLNTEADNPHWFGYSIITNNSDIEVRRVVAKYYVYGQDKKIWDITEKNVYETIPPGESTTVEVYVPKKSGFEEIKWVTPTLNRVFTKSSW